MKQYVITYGLIGLVVCTIYQNKYNAGAAGSLAGTIVGNLIGAALITLIWPVALIKIVSSK